MSTKFKKTVDSYLEHYSEKDRKEIFDYFNQFRDKGRKFKLYYKYQNKNLNLDNIKKAEKIKNESNNNVILNYNIEYISYRDNISIHESKIKIENFKKNKVTSKENFIKRYGEAEGLKKFARFQETSAKSSKNLKDKMTKEEWKQYNFERSKRCPEYYIKNNLAKNLNEAKLLVTEYQLSTSGVHKKYYENLNLDPNEIKEIFKSINSKKGLHIRNKSFLKEKYGNNWKIHYEKFQNDFRLRMESLKKWTPKELLSKFEIYKIECMSETRETVKKFGKEIKHLDKRSNEWHLDHMFSIKQGFLENIDPKIIGSYINLQILPKFTNLSKKDKCSISKEELINNYENFKNNKNI